MKNIPHQPGIYSITHTDSGRRYVGQATDLRKRKWYHFSSLRNNRHFNKYLQNAWNKYGQSAFVFEVLEICLSEPVILAAREQFWIDKHKKHLFNCRKFAEQFCADWHKTDEAKEVHQKASERMKAYRDNLKREFVCVQCEKPFVTNSPADNIRFCSAKCRGRWRWDTKAYTETRVCPVCGNEFLANIYHETKACSKLCAPLTNMPINFIHVPEIIRLVLDGKPIAEIARTYLVSEKVIRNIAGRKSFRAVAIPDDLENAIAERNAKNKHLGRKEKDWVPDDPPSLPLT